MSDRFYKNFDPLDAGAGIILEKPIEAEWRIYASVK